MANTECIIESSMHKGLYCFTESFEQSSRESLNMSHKEFFNLWRNLDTDLVLGSNEETRVYFPSREVAQIAVNHILRKISQK